MASFLLGLVIAIPCARIFAAAFFYRGYFEQKQRNLGKDPRESLDSCFQDGRFDRFMYYLLFWEPSRTANAKDRSQEHPAGSKEG
jgi:hypothetical protein